MNAKELNANLVCPRCMGFIPNNDTPGMYPGAISRTDDVTEICSGCGVDEAIENYANGSPLPKTLWLVQEK